MPSCSCHPVTNARKRAVNPLRIDPTRTGIVRRRFEADVRRRLKKLKREVVDFLVVKDALGLKTRRVLSFLVQERQYAYLVDDAKLVAFNDWLRQGIESNLYSVSPGTPPGALWTSSHIESSYRAGVVNAFFGAKKEGLVQGDIFESSEEFLRSSFAAPETMTKVRLLATRSFENMKGLGASIQADMNRILAQGMIEGRGVEDIARQMTSAIDGLSRGRAMLIARTEIIHAHAEGQLDSFQKLGIDELGVDIEWSTAGDGRVCPLCSGMEGQIFTVEEARGQIPLHPNCRCSWIPSFRDGKK